MRGLFNSRSLPALCALLLLGCSSIAAQTPAPDITVEEYCRLTVSLMELSVREWQGRLSTASQSKNKADRTKLRAELEKTTQGLREQGDALFRKSGLSRREYLRYASKHKSEIESHLEETPDLYNAIESLKKRIHDLIQDFELTLPKGRKGDQE